MMQSEIMPIDLQLCRTTWKVGARIGGGGFGQVYEATASSETGVVKLVRKAPGAERELLFVDLRGIRNVVPILDSGETEDFWVLVMPRADKSLREHLVKSDGALPVAEAVTTLSDIAAALVDLKGEVVHRDLKPENVLLLNEHWCLADFGISRYAEATTAPNTHKYSMSPPYAAPEQWRAERATGATDVYAVGIIAFELLTGNRPFPGPDYREQHLHSDPPRLEGFPPSLAALVDECLYKPSEARPSAANLLTRLERVVQPPRSPGLARLEEANRAVAEQRGQAGRTESAQRSDAERRKMLFEAAQRGFSSITNDLTIAIQGAASAAIEGNIVGGGMSLQLGDAELRIEPLSPTDTGQWGRRQVPSLTVIAHSSIAVFIPKDEWGYQGRSHSLWFCDAEDAGNFQWFETAFMITPGMRRSSPHAPFALNPGEESARALWTGIADFQVAWPFTGLTVGDLGEFISRWVGWLADAAAGRLRYPSTMPERPSEGSWRT